MKNYILTHHVFSPRDTALVLNKYPYALQKGIYHYVLFALQPLDSSSIQHEIQVKFKNRPVVWFINPLYLQSIKDLWHCHIFIRT